VSSARQEGKFANGVEEVMKKRRKAIKASARLAARSVQNFWGGKAASSATTITPTAAVG